MPKFLRNFKRYLFSLSFKQTLSLIFLLSLLVAIPLTVSAILTQRFDIRKEAKERTVKQRVLPPEEYIKQHEPANRKFEKVEIGKKTVYFHKRTIGEAIVEKDFINYQFDREKERFLKKTKSWRPDLPDKLPLLKITKEQAELMVTGEVKFTKLYFISPESDIFPFEPTPENPCWVVGSIDENNITAQNNITKLTVIDALTGEKIGLGVPPPASGYSLSGPIYFAPCRDSWTGWYANAHDWFEKMGYETIAVQWPSQEMMDDNIQNPSTVLFYELAHGDFLNFASGCLQGDYSERTYWNEVQYWMQERNKMPFAFLGSCNGMCQTGAGTFSYEFRKGSDQETTTVGYCGMGTSECLDCWGVSIWWQNSLFSYIFEGKTIKEAFDLALADWPVCEECMRFAGDENYKISIMPSPSPSPSQQADLLINNLEPTMSSPTSLKIDYQLSNQGQADAPGTKTYFYIDGKYKFYDNDPKIPASQSIPLLFYYGWSCTGGNYKMKLCADGGERVRESDEENNCLEKTLICPSPSPSPQPLPNLILYDIRFYKPRTTIETTPKAGELVTAFAVMKNTGDKDTGVFNVKWFLNDEQVGYGSHANLPPTREESQGNVRFDWTPEKGTHYLRFNADVDGHVKERSEGDNQVIKKVVVE